MKKKLLYISFILLFLVLITGCVSEVKKLESISLDVNSQLPLNATASIKVNYIPKDVAEDITWVSSDETIISVDSTGTLTTKAVGNVIITATTASGIKATKNIEVYKKTESLALSTNKIELYVGETSAITTTILPEDATYKDINWNTSNSNVAEVDHGNIMAKSVGETTITAITKDGVENKCIIIVKDKPIEFSGNGDKIISNIVVPSGNYKAVMTNNGRSNFIVKFYEDINDSYCDLLANEIGNYKGSALLKEGGISPISNGMLEIKSSGSWTIKFEQIIGNIDGKSVSGQGDVITSWFKGEGKRVIATFSNSGSSNFIVKVYDDYGNYDLLVNEIGTYNGQSTFITNSYSKYYFSVISSGSWSIKWE